MKKGIPASKGYAIGRIVIKEESGLKIENTYVSNVSEEKARFERALILSKKQLEKIKTKTKHQLGKGKAEVFESHIMLLEDIEFAGAIELKIEKEHINAEKAVYDIVNLYMETFKLMKDEYIRERAMDIKDVGDRILSNLTGNITSLGNLSSNTVIAAHDLTPSDTVQLDKNKVIAFITDLGGKTSHSVIMAKAFQIPAVVGMKDITSYVKNGDLVIVDGVEGIVMVNPSKELVEKYKIKIEEYGIEKEKLKSIINLKTVTKSGKQIKLLGNIERCEDVEQVIKNGGDGIGLFRTEFLYMDRDAMPQEDEQFEAYKYVLEKMKNKPVVIRTLDIGGDKKLPYFPMEEECNPFLGYRSIRICLDRKDIFKVQLRALLRASVFGNLKIMFPMISSVGEFLQAKEVLKECMEELALEKREFNRELQVGIMVEVPAAAINADEMAKYADFFSIGTNDLIQYTLAVDRVNEKVAYLYDPMHPAVLSLIKTTIEAAHKNKKLCSMCGEMASDENAIKYLVECELDEFSMSPQSILKIKQFIKSYC
ncbi:phosphoenolpyruvate--protein phosphotransferase [Clostridium kluyveri]|uniref:Phosphoenolpyruvate-protein phosphotransferase n=1 Tax=Clostridium kluyveri TaxID=1534 RepID=A0A1L5F3J8_CLOKL|nr:phosphoenolpyruvate--protein phosphotransferase [Clostridium kluyveri]APM37598.1 phosphoenolpyruvate--protein phosphotransferase [Clostridium kluyveri]